MSSTPPCFRSTCGSSTTVPAHGCRGLAALGSLLLVGGVVFVALHAVSDIGIYGVLDGKLATFGAQHDHSVSYTLYLLTYAVDSVADVFGSVFAFAAGVLVFRSGILPRWLGWVSILAAPLLFLQAFGLGGVIASFGLVLDLIGFVLLLLFVLVSSVILLRREPWIETSLESGRQLWRGRTVAPRPVAYGGTFKEIGWRSLLVGPRVI